MSWDVYKQFVNKDASDKSITLLSRMAIGLSTVITLYLAKFNPPKLLAWRIWMTIGVMLACFVTPLFSGCTGAERRARALAPP